jgi:hypothetical protein
MHFTDNNFVLLSAVKSIRVIFNDRLYVKDEILAFNSIEILIQRVLDDGNDKAVEISVYGDTNAPFYTGYVTFKPTEEEMKKVGYYVPYEECKANAFARSVVNHLLYCADDGNMLEKFKDFEFEHNFKEDKKE